MQKQGWRRLSLSLLVVCCLSIGLNWVLYQAWLQNKPSDPVVTNAMPYFNLTGSQQTLLETPLLNQNIQLALQRWQELTKTDADLAMKLQQSWYKQAQDWLKQGRIQPYLNLMQTWQDIAPDLLEVKLLAYAWYLSQADLANAADIIYSIQSQLQPKRYQQTELNKLHQLLQSEIKKILSEQRCKSVIDTLEMLVWYENSHPEYLLALSRCYIQLGEFELAEQQLIYLLVEPKYQKQANEILAKIQVSPNEGVPLTQYGEHYLVQAQFSEQIDITLMIDTGASITSITRNAFDQLSVYVDVTHLGFKQMSTAGGLTQAEIIEVKQIQIGHKVISPFIIAVLEVDSFGNAEGLLGMDFLTQFPFIINQKAQKLTFVQE